MRNFIVALLGILMTAALGLAQTPRPATQSSSTKPTRIPTSIPTAGLSKTDLTAVDFLNKGIKQLEDGSNQDAQKSFTDGLAVYGPPQSSSLNDSMPHAALNHSLAVAELRLNHLPPARTAVDHANGSKWTNDSLIFNTASVETAINGMAILAVNSLDTYLANHPDADESWVNLYGLALQKASKSTDPTIRTKLAPHYKTLDTYQARLEKTRPGMHRWGSSWLTDDEWKQIQPQVDAAKKHMAQLEQNVDSAQKQLNAAIQQASSQSPAANSGGGGGGGGGRGRGGRGRGGGGGGASPSATPAQTPAERARQQLTQAQQALAKADPGPQPEWNIELVGIIPDLDMVQKGAATPTSTASTKPAGRRGP